MYSSRIFLVDLSITPRVDHIDKHTTHHTFPTRAHRVEYPMRQLNRFSTPVPDAMELLQPGSRRDHLPTGHGKHASAGGFTLLSSAECYKRFIASPATGTPAATSGSAPHPGSRKKNSARGKAQVHDSQQQEVEQDSS